MTLLGPPLMPVDTPDRPRPSEGRFFGQV